MNYTFLIAMCDLAAWQLLLGLLLPFLLGLLLRHFLAGNDKQKYDQLQTDYTHLQSDYSKVSTQKMSLGNVETEYKKLQQSAKGYESQISKLKADVESANNRAKQVQKPIIDISSYTSKISGLETANHSLQKTIDELNAAIASKSTNTTATELDSTTANAFTDKITYLEAENARLKLDVKTAIAAKDNIERTNENVRKMKEEIRDMSGRIGGYTVESDRLKKEAAEAKASASSAVQELNDLKNKISASQNDNDKAAVLANDYEGKIRTLQTDLANANMKIASLNKVEESLTEVKGKLVEAEINASSARLKLEEVQKIVPVEKIIEVSSVEDQNKIKALEAEIALLKAATTVIVADKPPIKTDDLILIEGIGPKVNALFAAKGITTYAQLAAMTNEEVAAILTSGGNTFQMLNGNSWPKQAALLRDGKMEEFETYTDYLIAGVDPNEVKKAVETKVDDLKIVEGIGPKIEGLLNNAGIFSFEQLANANTESLQDILENAGSRYQIHDPSTWAKQAKLAAEGKMEELQKWQDELKGGKA